MSFKQEVYLQKLQSLVDIPSPSGDRVGAMRVIEELKKELGDAVQVSTPSSSKGYADNYWFSFSGTGKGNILLLGHVDTIGPMHLPFSIKEGQAYGRGTYDMKAGVLMAIKLLQDFAKKPDLFETISLFLSCDEETRETPMPLDKDAKWDAVLSFEGGVQKEGVVQLVSSRVGSGQLRIQAQGKASHSGLAAHKGRSALRALLKVDRYLQNIKINQTSFNPVQIHSGEQMNMIPDRGELLYDVRCSNHVDLADFRLSSEVDGVSLSSQFSMRYPPMTATPQTSRLLRNLKDSGVEVCGVGRKGSGDINFFAGHANILLDGLGPFASQFDPSHSMHEHISIHNLQDCYQTGKSTIEHILKTV